MVIHRDQRRADVRDVLDEFEKWLLQERSAQECTAAAYTARVAAFVEWLPAPVEESLGKLTAAMVIEWVNLEAARGLKASTLGKQLVMLRSFLQYAHRCGRMRQELSGVVPHAAAWRLSSIPDPVPGARSRPCSTLSICVHRRGCVTGRSCCSSPGSGCALVRSLGFGSMTSAGAPEAYASGARATASMNSHCPTRSATPWRITCSTAAAAGSRARRCSGRSSIRSSR
ncbi:MAG: site-specific integrase [Austwickia sp.]|nr:site-specific integrase [Austwickia sp.]